MTYIIKIELENVSDGDVIDLAQEIWDTNARDFDADSGEFKVSATKDGFPLDVETGE